MFPEWRQNKKPARGTEFTNARLACDGTMLHLYYTALFAVIIANAIAILLVIAVAISSRKRDN
jgi:hypothetical protein